MDGDTFSTPEAPDDAATIVRLAALSPISYDRVRVAEAARVGCRIETLDRQVEIARREAAAVQEQVEHDAEPAAAEDEPMGHAEAAIEIAQAAMMDDITYAQQRKGIAARIGITVAALEKQVAAGRRAATQPEDEDNPETGNAPRLSHDALALRFTRKHGAYFRYVALWGKWFRWNGQRWEQDSTLAVFDLARAICRAVAARENDPSIGAAIAAASTIAAVERLCRSDRCHAATADQWDADPWLLNTPCGVMDLRTGQSRAARQDDYMTKITAAAPGGECLLWHQFLAKITNGDGELQAYLQRVAGYSLTGITTEHALFFGYGRGANGKGTFLNTLTSLMGDYAVISTMETFTASPTDRHPTDLAMLRGARLVSAQETEEGRKWAESRIKALTGGDPITARFMRQDFFTFDPAFKLFIAGNHKPALRGVDEAIRRRFNLIPFTVTIPPAERDKDLAKKLKAEWPGILAWAVQGCLDWQSQGLAPPVAVVDATEEYMAEEDSLSRWVAERCKTIGYGGAECTSLFADWRAWAIAAGEEPGSQKRFSQAMEGKGYQKDPKARHATFQGIVLDDTSPAWHEREGDRA